MFSKKKRTCLHLSITQGTDILFQGELVSLPFPESILIEKSITFYDDPEPCFLHRSAVRNRLLFEIEEEMTLVDPRLRTDTSILVTLPPRTCPLLLFYTSFSAATQITCYHA